MTNDYPWSDLENSLKVTNIDCCLHITILSVVTKFKDIGYKGSFCDDLENRVKVMKIDWGLHNSPMYVVAKFERIRFNGSWDIKLHKKSDMKNTKLCDDLENKVKVMKINWSWRILLMYAVTKFERIR